MVIDHVCTGTISIICTGTISKYLHRDYIYYLLHRDYANAAELREILDQLFQANLTLFALLLPTFGWCTSSCRVESDKG